MKKLLLITITVLFAAGPLMAQEGVRFFRPLGDDVPLNGSFLFGETSSTSGTQLGVDFLTSAGDTVYAAHDGVVGLNSSDGDYGTFIVIDGMWKEEKVNTLYGQLTETLVAQDDSVSRGDPIGLGGDSSTEAAVHFQVRYGWHSDEDPLDGSWLNPELWVAMDTTGVIVGTVPGAASATRVDIAPDPKPRPPYQNYGWSLTYDFDSESRLGSDPDYLDNYVIGDVKEGTYTITSGDYSKTVEVVAGQITSVEGIEVTSFEEEKQIANNIRLSQNYPNPFNPTTVISYSIPKSSHVKLAVYDIVGKQVAVLTDQQMSAGNHDVTFHASDLSSGIYLYRLTVGNEMLTRKLTLIK